MSAPEHGDLLKHFHAIRQADAAVLRAVLHQPDDGHAPAPLPPSRRILAALVQTSGYTTSVEQLAELAANIARQAPDLLGTLLAAKCREVAHGWSPVELLDWIGPRLDGQSPDLLREYGQACLRVGRIAKALPYLEQALERTPSSQWSLTLAGQAWLAVGRLEDAETAFRQAAALAPDAEAPLTTQAVLALARRRPGDAAELLEVARTRQPGLHYLLSWLAVAQAWQGRAGEALDLAARSVAIVPYPPSAWMYSNQALVLLWLGRPDDAVAAQRQAILLGAPFLPFMDALRPFAQDHLALLNAAADGSAPAIETLRTRPCFPS